jgi:hypothetical protein
MWESKAWETLGQILNLIITLVLLFGLWSAIVDLQKQVQRVDIESERRFKSLEERVLERVGDKWKDNAKNHLHNLFLPPQ